MITFSGAAGTAEDWPEQRGDAIMAREARTHARMAADLDMLRGMLAREMKTSWAGFSQSETLAHRKNKRRALRVATLAQGKISPAAKFWCGREDSNLHGIATASPSSWCVFQFRQYREHLNIPSYPTRCSSDVLASPRRAP